MLTFPKFEPHFPRHLWTLPAVLEHQARVRGDKPFFRWTEKEDYHTYAQTNRAVNRLAHGLLAQGIGKGDRIVIFKRNSTDFAFLYLAANKIGAVEAPINTAYRGSFLEHQVNICEASTIVVEQDLLDRVLESLPVMPKVARIFVWSPPGSAEQPLPSIEGRSIDRFEVLRSENEENPDCDVRPHDLAAIMFTSGTTGLSKGVLMTHAQIYFFSEQCCQLTRLTEDDVYMSALPLFHANPQVLTINCSMIAGGKCVMFDRFSATEWVSRLVDTGTTVTNCVGAMLAFVHAQPRTPNDLAHKLRCILSAPTPWEILDELKERFGVYDFVECFGQTEINIPFMTLPDVPRPQGSIGVLVDQWYEARIVDPETDEEVPVGTVGELMVRPRVPWILNQGYVNMPDKTAEAFRNLWFHTGDALKRDEQGWFYFLDRFKDTLRRRGENISSFEVETPLRLHPAVADVAVVAVKSEYAGGEDEVKAVVVLKKSHDASGEDLVRWCEPRMPYFAVPRYFEFLDRLPTSASEKVQKNLLRDRGVSPDTWDRVKAGVQLQQEIERSKTGKRATAAGQPARG